MTNRLKAALAVGDTMKLFSLFADWPPTELRALVDDCDAYCQEAHVAIDAAYKKAIFAPEVFFNSRASKEIDTARADGMLQILGVAQRSVLWRCTIWGDEDKSEDGSE